MEQGEDVPDGFDKQSIPRRSAVIFSGSFMNFVLAALLFWVVGITYGKTVGVTNRIERVLPGTPAAKAGLRVGDRIVEVAGKRGDVETLREQIQNRPGKRVHIVIARRGREVKVSLVALVKDALDEMKSGVLKPAKVGAIGIVFATKRVPMGFFESLKMGVLTTYYKTALMIRVMLATVGGHLPLQVGGPVRIVHEMVEAANVGWVNFLALSAFLSLNIGFINLLPFPALDGSRLMFLGIEAARRRPVDPRKEALVHLVGFAILILVIMLVVYQDILYLVRKQ
jgi:regulator of sigma E protease